MRLALIAVIPIVATIAALGASSSAQAWTTQSTCSNYRICYYNDAYYQPTWEILNIGQQNVPDWTNIPSHTCSGNGNWNDCASSIIDKMTAYIMCNYDNAGYGYPLLIASPGQDFPNLANNNFNDTISSNRFVSHVNFC